MKKLILFLLCICGLNTGFTIAQSLSDGEYFIKINATGRYLAIEGISHENGARLVQWDFVNQGNHKFILKHLGHNTYTIQAVHSKKYLSAEGASPKAGAAVLQWDYINQENQQWLITPATNGKGYTVRCLKNYLKLVLDNFQSATATPQNGTALKLISNEDLPPMTLDFKKNEAEKPAGGSYFPKGESKKLPLESIPDRTKMLTDVPDGIYKIRINETGKYLAIAGLLDHTNGQRLIQWDMLPRNNHLFKITRLGNGNFRIAALHSEKVLDVVDMQTSDGTQVQQWEDRDGPHQQWKFFDAGDGNLRIISAGSNKGLQLSSGVANKNNGTPLIINTDAVQTFRLQPARRYEGAELISISNLRLTVPHGGDLAIFGQIEVLVVDKNGNSYDRYYLSPFDHYSGSDNFLFFKPENAAIDMDEQRVVDIPVNLLFGISHAELPGAKLIIKYGLNEDDADVSLTKFGSTPIERKSPTAARPFSPFVFHSGGNDDFFLVKSLLSSCVKSTITDNKQNILITDIPSSCISHVYLQDEDGSDNYIDVFFTIKRETKLQ